MNSITFGTIAVFLVFFDSRSHSVQATVDRGCESQIGYLYGGRYAPRYQNIGLIDGSGGCGGCDGGGSYSAVPITSVPFVSAPITSVPHHCQSTYVAVNPTAAASSSYYATQAGYGLVATNNINNCNYGCGPGTLVEGPATCKKTELLNKLLLKKTQKLANKADGPLIQQQQQWLVKPYCNPGGIYC